MEECEIQLLLLYYIFSDQYGVVDIQSASEWYFKNSNLVLKEPFFQLEQYHLNLLMDAGAIPDIRDILSKFCVLQN